MTEHYIENEAYGAVVNAIATITHLAPDEIKIALGEHGNIWPRRIQSYARHTARPSVEQQDHP
jgi:hypothetical protein